MKNETKSIRKSRPLNLLGINKYHILAKTCNWKPELSDLFIQKIWVLCLNKNLDIKFHFSFDSHLSRISCSTVSGHYVKLRDNSIFLARIIDNFKFKVSYIKFHFAPKNCAVCQPFSTALPSPIKMHSLILMNLTIFQTLNYQKSATQI